MVVHNVLIPEASWPRVADALADLPVVPLRFTRDSTVVDLDGAASDLPIHGAWHNFEIARGQFRSFAERVLASDALEFFQTAAAGLDSPFFERLAKKPVRLANSDSQALPIAEYVLASLLNVFHDFPARRALQAQRGWKLVPFRELAGCHCVVVGYGHIGARIVRRLAAFEARISVVRRRAEPAPEADRTGTLDDLPTFLADADVVVLASALNTQTRNILDAEMLARCRAGVVIVNIARGVMIDESALLEALDRGHVGHAVLDVFTEEPLPDTHPFWAHDRVTVSAHASNHGSGRMARGDALFVDNLRAFLAGESLRNEVDLARLDPQD